MGFGAAFQSAWNKASNTVKAKVAQVATTAKQVANKIVDTAQQTTQQAREKASFIVQQMSKDVTAAKKVVVTSVDTAKNQVAKAVEKAKQNVKNIAEKASQNAKEVVEQTKQTRNKFKKAVKQKVKSFSKKVKKTFKKIKKEFDDCKQLNKPIQACPYGQFLYHNVENGSKEGKLKLEGDAALYKYKKETNEATFESSVIYGKAGMDGTRISAEASALKLAGILQTGDDPLNPSDRIDSEIKLANVEAKGDFFVGYDTTRIGASIGGKLEASSISASVKSEKNIALPFWDWSISVRSGFDGSIGSAGVGGGGHGYWDIQEKRFHLGGFGDVDLLGGLGLALDISIGKKYTTKDRRADW